MNTIYRPLPFLIILFVVTLALFTGCSQESGSLTHKTAMAYPEPVKKEVEKTIPLDLKKVHGKWLLKYPKNYGYLFHFYKNFKAIVVLYLNTHSLVFKGVYTLENKNVIRINIIEMKRVKKMRYMNFKRGFSKTKSSSFSFACTLAEKNRILLLKPMRIVIDGNNSEGYFEPRIKLKKQ